MKHIFKHSAISVSILFFLTSCADHATTVNLEQSSSSLEQGSSSTLSSSNTLSSYAHSSSSTALPSSSSVARSSSSSISPQVCTYIAGANSDPGTLECPEKTYATVVIGNQIWMAENLNYYTGTGSWCYARNEDNCATYGRLYNWVTANSVCPVDWHLPSDSEWTTLETTVGGTSSAGSKLKSTSILWITNGSGTDDYGFAALPGGNYDMDNYNAKSVDGYWWTSTNLGSTDAYYRRLSGNANSSFRDDYSKTIAFSVRCIKDFN